MSKHQRRFTKDFEVLAEILKYRRKGKMKLEAAQVIEATMQGIVDSMNAPGATDGDVAFLKEQHAGWKKKATKLRRTVEIINKEAIPRLTRTLAALQTVPLKGFNDEGVVLQK